MTLKEFGKDVEPFGRKQVLDYIDARIRELRAKRDAGPLGTLGQWRDEQNIYAGAIDALQAMRNTFYGAWLPKDDGSCPLGSIKLGDD